MSRLGGWWFLADTEDDRGFATVRHLCLTSTEPRPREILACSRPLFRFSLAFSQAMAVRLIFPALPAGDVEPTCLDDCLGLAEADGDFLDSVFAFWDLHGGPLVAVDAASPVGAFLAPVVAARGGNVSLPLHLLEFLFARFLVLTSELVDPAHPGYRFSAMAISPARLERVFDSLVESGLDTAVSTVDGVVTAIMTLRASVSFVHEQWALFADDLIPLQCGYTEVDMAPLLFPLNLVPAGGEPPARRWLAGIELATMRCPRYTLPPFADLAGFYGVRASLEARLTDPAAPVPPLTGEYRAAVETLTDLTRPTGVGPPALLFARGSTVVDRLLPQPAVATVTRRLARGLPGLAPRRTRSRALL